MSAATENPGDLPPSIETGRDMTGWTHSEFFRIHSPRLESLIRGRLSPRFQARFDAADVVQSAFRSFFLRRPSDQLTFTTEGDLWPLLVEIAIRKLSRQIRRHSAQRRSVTVDAGDVLDAVSATGGPVEAASLSEIIALAEATLDEAARVTFAMRLEGFEILEIAARTHVSERTIRRHLSAAKQVLKRLLDLEPAIATQGSAEPPSSTLLTALRFDDYRLHQWIGDGAIGKVYRATEKSTGRTVAVKFLKKAFRFHHQAVASFQREVRIVAQLSHPGIIRIIGIGKTQNQGDFLVMDWASGGDLARCISTGRPRLAAIRSWILGLADALQHAHEHGVIHCDLKPSNVLINAEGQLQLCDFGLARQLVGWSDLTSATGGTPAFIAPELVEPSWGPIGPWTDVFGLGAILFSLLTGSPPHQGRTLDEILINLVSASPIIWPSFATVSIPEAWQACVNGLLAKLVSTRVRDMVAAKQIVQALPIDDLS